MKKSNTNLVKIGLTSGIIIIAAITIWQFSKGSTEKSNKLEGKVEKVVPKTPQELLLDSMTTELQEDGSFVREIMFKGVKYDVFVSDLRSVKLQMHWKEKGKLLKDINSLKNSVEEKGEELLFATNGGIYDHDFTPEGLYIEDGKMLKGLNKREENGNFYLKPNGVFLVADNQSAAVVTTENFPKLFNTLKGNGLKVDFAVQSGPQLLIDGKVHPKFNEASSNKYIRNGVGIFNNNSKKVIFAISQKEVNFYDFASFFYEVMKCDDALYLDGFVSRMYTKDGRKNLNGNFTTMISATKK
jgi:uncharacterized protein YigE (DUF2233 family)